MRRPIDAVALLSRLLRAADAKPTLDPERSTRLGCFVCGTTATPRALVTVGYWTRKTTRGGAGDPIDRPMCESCREATDPPVVSVTRTVPCCMCRSDVTLGSSTTPDPECPEMLRVPPPAAVGVVGSPGGGTIIVTCGPSCLDKLMAQGLFQ